MACHSEPKFLDLASQLTAANLKRKAGGFLVWGPRPSGAGVVCVPCGAQRVALLANPACGHVACADCWADSHESQLPSCRTVLAFRPHCFERGCGLIVANDIKDFAFSQCSRLSTYAAEIGSEAARLRLTAGKSLVWGNPSEPGPVCPTCQGRRLALLINTECGHTACEDCWSRWVEDKISGCRSMKRLMPGCFGHECSLPISSEIMRHACTRSALIREFVRQVDSEIARLRRIADPMLVWAPWPSQAGPMCPTCHEHCFAVFANPGCGHVACEDCWSKWGEEQLQDCIATAKVRPQCIAQDCSMCLAERVWRHACTRSPELLGKFLSEMDSKMARLQRTAGEALIVASPSKPVLVCSICSECQIALLETPACKHAACEDCWSQWAAQQLTRCRAEKLASLRCIGATCCASVPETVWSHACTRSDAVASLEAEFALRRRLRANVLYPFEVQVECPVRGCLGLGYLGHDTVMCFACEHQWQVGDGEAPSEEVGELLAGEVVKRCPSCGEHIIKNGGCDHMTCRCGYQFWWTTMQPYARGAH